MHLTILTKSESLIRNYEESSGLLSRCQEKKDLTIQDNHGLLMWDIYHVYFQNKLAYLLLLITETLRKEKVKAAGAAFTP